MWNESLCSICRMAECFLEKLSRCWNEQIFKVMCISLCSVLRFQCCTNKTVHKLLCILVHTIIAIPRHCDANIVVSQINYRTEILKSSFRHTNVKSVCRLITHLNMYSLVWRVHLSVDVPNLSVDFTLPNPRVVLNLSTNIPQDFGALQNCSVCIALSMWQ